jgi:hypothetical protein
MHDRDADLMRDTCDNCGSDNTAGLWQYEPRRWQCLRHKCEIATGRRVPTRVLASGAGRHYDGPARADDDVVPLTVRTPRRAYGSDNDCGDCRLTTLER